MKEYKMKYWNRNIYKWQAIPQYSIKTPPTIDKILQTYYAEYYKPHLSSINTTIDIVSPDKWSIGGVFLAGFITGFTLAKSM